MKKGWKALAAMLLALMLPLGSACASIVGLDETLSGYLDADGDLRYSLSLQVGALQPYGEETLTMMNTVLGHIRVAASETDAGAESALNLCVDGESVMDLTQRAAGESTSLTTSLLPNRTLVSGESPLDRLMGTETGEAEFDALLAIQEVEGCYQTLTDAILPYAEQKKANYKIKDIATSRWSRIARLTTEQSTELAPLIAQVLGCGMDAAFRAELEKMTYAKGFIVGLYQSEENGEDLAVYIKGTVTMGDGTTRQLSYQWAFTGDAAERIDTYKFELTQGKGDAENRTISATYRRGEADGAYSVKGEWSAAIKRGTSTVTTTVEHDLTGAAGTDARTLEGTVTTAVKTAADGETETVTTTLTPALKLTSAAEGDILAGTVALEEMTGKNVTKALTVTFDEEPLQVTAQPEESADAAPAAAEGEPVYDPMPQSSLSQNEEPVDGVDSDYLVGQPPIGYQIYEVPDTMQTYDLDAAQADQLEALRGELYQNLAGRLLIALAKLPAEDAALLADNMSEEDYAAFLNLVQP